MTEPIARPRGPRPRLSCRRGIAALEFALIVPLFLIMLLATVDFGLWIVGQMQLQTALVAGGHYAQSFPTDTTGITNAVGTVMPAAASLVTVSLSSDCGPGSTVASNGDSSCSPGTRRVYVTLAAQIPFTPLYMSTFLNISNQYVVRVQ